jgi:hypothetical protein
MKQKQEFRIPTRLYQKVIDIVHIQAQIQSRYRDLRL